MNPNASMDTSQYPSKMHWYAASPTIVAIFGTFLNGQPTETFSVLGLAYVVLQFLSVIALLIAYFYQRSFLAPKYAERLKYQKVFILSAFILPSVAAILGDLHGQVTFGSNATSSSFVISAILTTITIGIFAIEICALGNLLFILTKGTSTIISVLGVIVRIIAWLLILFVTYMAYGLAYSARDPNSE